MTGLIWWVLYWREMWAEMVPPPDRGANVVDLAQWRRTHPRRAA